LSFEIFGFGNVVLLEDLVLTVRESSDSQNQVFFVREVLDGHVDSGVQPLLIGVPLILLDQTFYRWRTSANSVDDLRLLERKYCLVADCNQHESGTPLAVNVR
jgi:hypothetical protein